MSYRNSEVNADNKAYSHDLKGVFCLRIMVEIYIYQIIYYYDFTHDRLQLYYVF